MITGESARKLEERLESLAETALDELDYTRWPTGKNQLAQQERYRLQRAAGRTLDTMLRIASLLADNEPPRGGGFRSAG
jgi:hypothetical protein